VNKFLKLAGGLTLLLSAEDLRGASAALARGGASNLMNSPGYQRRLQESRGYVTNQSGSVFTTQPPHPVYRTRKWRQRN
jgi:hypothetical protein